MTPSAAVDVFIIGGGITGLSAAWEIEKKRQAGSALTYRLAEGGKRLGGKILTERVGPFLLEGGPDSFITVKPAGMALCKELGLEAELVAANAKDKTVYIYSRGRLRALPPELMLARSPSAVDFLGSSLLSWSGKIRALCEPFVSKGSQADETLASFIQRRFGSEMLEKIIQPLASGVYAGIPEAMSLKSTFPRLAELEASHGSVIRGLRRETKSSAFGGDKPGFVSLKGGLGRLVEALSQKIPPQFVASGTRATIFAGKVNQDYVFQLEGAQAVQARSVIFACPAYDASWILRQMDAGLAALEEIPYSHSIIVCLAYTKTQFPEANGFGFLMPRKENSPLLGVSFPSVKFGGRAPQDQVLVRCFLGGAGNPKIVELKDEQIISLARAELEKILRFKGEPSMTRIYRWPKANPQYQSGHASKVARIRRELARFPGIALAGAGYDGIGIPDCIASGQKAAKQVLTYLGK